MQRRLSLDPEISQTNALVTLLYCRQNAFTQLRCKAWDDAVSCPVSVCIARDTSWAGYCSCRWWQWQMFMYVTCFDQKSCEHSSTPIWVQFESRWVGRATLPHYLDSNQTQTSVRECSHSFWIQIRRKSTRLIHILSIWFPVKGKRPLSLFGFKLNAD